MVRDGGKKLINTRIVELFVIGFCLKGKIHTDLLRNTQRDTDQFLSFLDPRNLFPIHFNCRRNGLAV